MSSYIRTGWETGFFQSPNCIFDVEDLSTYEKICYLYLCRCADRDMKSFPSYNTIANKMSANRSTAIKAVKSLEEKGYLQVERRKKTKDENLPNIYTLIHPDQVIHKDDSNSQEQAIGSCYEQLGVVDDNNQVVVESNQGSGTERPNKYSFKNTQLKKDIHIDSGHAEKKEFQFYDWVNSK
jgi:predicted transcriptional regulator